MDMGEDDEQTDSDESTAIDGGAEMLENSVPSNSSFSTERVPMSSSPRTHTSSGSSVDSSDTEACERKSCGQVEAEEEPVDCMEEEINTVTMEDLDEYISPDEDAKVAKVVKVPSKQPPKLADPETCFTAPPAGFEDAPFAVYSPEIRKMWSEPDASDVPVRGKKYMQDQVKVPAGKAIGKLLHVDLWTMKTPESRHHVAMQEERRPHSVLAYCREKFPDSLVFMMNFELPNAENLSLVAYWLLPPASAAPQDGDTSAFHRLLNRFCSEGDDEFRNARFKLIPNLVDGPWILQQLVPNRPALTGLKLTQHYFRRKNYFELDLDVSSSKTAQYIGGMVQSWASSLEMHLFLTIQGEEEDELQERVLGAINASYLNLELAREFQ